MDLVEYARGSDLAHDPLVVDLATEVERLRLEVAQPGSDQAAPRNGDVRRFRLAGTEWDGTGSHHEGDVVTARYDSHWGAWEITDGSEFFVHTVDMPNSYPEWGGDPVPDEPTATEAGDFLRMVADAWGADPDGWSHYIETDRDTRNLLRELAEKLDKRQYDLN